MRFEPYRLRFAYIFLLTSILCQLKLLLVNTMKKETINIGFVTFAFGLIVWVIGRLIGFIPIFMPLIMVVGIIMIITGLFQKGN